MEVLCRHPGQDLIIITETAVAEDGEAAEVEEGVAEDAVVENSKRKHHLPQKNLTANSIPIWRKLQSRFLKHNSIKKVL